MGYGKLDNSEILNWNFSIHPDVEVKTVLETVTLKAAENWLKIIE